MRRSPNIMIPVALAVSSFCAYPVSAAKPSLQTVFSFYGPMPTGVTVSHQGRIFVCYPHWGDPVRFTVGELRGGKEVSYPNLAVNKERAGDLAGRLVSVQSVVVDSADRLWLLDTGSIKFGPVSYGGPKLVGIDLRTNKIVKKILFPSTVALKTSYLNDVRFDLRRGKAGVAYITDSSDKGPNGIIVVDLASGRSWRRLNDDPTTKAEPGLVPVVEGQKLLQRKPGQPPAPMKNGTDGIALSPDGKTLYYCALIGRRLHRVSAAALADPNQTDAQVKATVKDLGEKPASDGLETSGNGMFYATDYEHHRVVQGAPGGPYRTLVSTPNVYDWPDTLSVAANGYLYFTANQLQRQASYHFGKDLRRKPYVLYRIRIDGKPINLKARG